MPEPYTPDYALWKQVFENHPVGRETLLVGHSCGAGFLVRWLSEQKRQVKKLILVAPWLDPFSQKCPDFFRFEIDQELASRQPVEIFMSDDDEADILESVSRLKAALPTVTVHSFSSYGHFTLGDMNTTIFPELLNACLRV